MKNKRIPATIIATLILLAFFFAQGAIVSVNHIEGTASALVRGGVIWSLVIGTILFFVIKHKRIADLGFRRPKDDTARSLLFFIPLLIIAFSHFAAGFDDAEGVGYIAANLFLTLSIGMAEELYFRGIICNMWLKKGPVRAMIVSSILFGVCHLMNIAGGAGPAATLLQICFAILYGLVFALIFIRSNSLIPCVLLHALHDMCSFLSAEGSVTMSIVLGAIQTVILILYFVYLLKNTGIKVLPRSDSL